MAVSLRERQLTFGASSLLGLRRGAGHVPNVSQNAAVPTTAPIALSQLAGAVNYVPLSINGPSLVSLGTIPVSRPPSSASHAAGTSTSGGSGSITATWQRISGSSIPVCSNTAAVNPTFSCVGNLGNTGGGGTETLTAVWRLTVGDGHSSAFKDITISVSRDLP
ncbi:hypothetical protein [Luteibacter yeojuensis]|uniref:Uncharacterized protein n=1 Tax=Luteibacter yeojuensis TaxID=345309 RepID=A0A7X5TPY9_9GAMM|nr:hypothetical protein [Luteibacter yeojuensis]NID14972.1 hypothetical protein [Luteibacter yeojuensis]